MRTRSITPLLRSGVQARHFSTTRVHYAFRPSGNALPPNYPQVDYAGSVMHVFRGIGRVFRYIIYFSTGTIVVGAVAFEGLHTYVEHGPLSAPTRQGADDEYGWADEVQGWTGGVSGGTDPRLGWKGRHAVRAAWMCQTWGAGSSAMSQGLFEPDYQAVKGMIGVDASAKQVDRGYEMADDFLDVAIAAASQRGIVFPPTLSVARPVGPPTASAPTIPPELQGDPLAVDLLLLKAGNLERVATNESLVHAKELYEQVLCAIHGSAGTAKVLRLTAKLGDLCARVGDDQEAVAWWSWGLKRVGLEVPLEVQVVKEVKAATTKRSWFGSKSTTWERSSTPSSLVPSVTPHHLSPPTLRAAISVLTTSSAFLATHEQLPEAAALQTTALTLLPAPSLVPPPTTATAGLTLHTAWLQQRSALLTLHLASVTHALRKPALHLATTASARADTVVSSISPLSNVYRGTLLPPAKILHRDALLTAAEAAYTRGVLLDRQAQAPPAALTEATECFEKAVALSVRESGRQGEEGGPEYQKYHRSLERVKEKISGSQSHSTA